MAERQLQRIGYVALVAALTWLTAGSPGVPAVAEFATTNIEPWLPAGAIVLGAIVLASGIGLAEPAYPWAIRMFLPLPFSALLVLVRTVALICGIGAASVAAAVPAALVLHALGLAG
jgi:hypothetical protein